jgi:hypothetical protein
MWFLTEISLLPTRLQLPTIPALKVDFDAGINFKYEHGPKKLSENRGLGDGNISYFKQLPHKRRQLSR